MVKMYLKSKGKEFTEVDIEEDVEAQKVIVAETGSPSVPVTKIGDTYITGFKPNKLGELL